MIIEDAILNRIENNNSDKIHDLLSCGKTPDTKDILANIELSWFIKNQNKRIDTSHIFNKNKEYRVEDINTVHISWKCYKMIVRTIDIPISALEISSDIVTVSELEPLIYQYTVNSIKELFPKSDIFFKTLLIAKEGGKV